MKTWIVSSLDEETIQGKETIQGRKLYEEIRYTSMDQAAITFSAEWIEQFRAEKGLYNNNWGFYRCYKGV
jgi:hypothetical protein